MLKILPKMGKCVKRETLGPAVGSIQQVHAFAVKSPHTGKQAEHSLNSSFSI
jgi:hypothetical protein